MKSGAWRSAPTARGLLRPASSALVKVWDAQTGQVSVEFTGHTGDRLLRGLAPRRPADRLRRLGRSSCLPSRSGTRGPDRKSSSSRLDRAGRSSSPWRSAPTAATWSREKRTEPCKSGTRGPARRSARSAPTTGQIRGVVFSRDGRHLASASGDGKVKLWDATRLDEKQEARRTLQARVPGPSLNVAFSPDGRRLATGGEENTVKIWDVRDRPGAANPPGTQRGRLHRGLQPRRRWPVGRLGG